MANYLGKLGFGRIDIKITEDLPLIPSNYTRVSSEPQSSEFTRLVCSEVVCVCQTLL